MNSRKLIYLKENRKDNFFCKIIGQKLDLKIEGQTFLKGKCQMVDLLVTKIKVL